MTTLLNEICASGLLWYDHYYHTTLGSFAPLSVQAGANAKFLNG